MPKYRILTPLAKSIQQYSAGFLHLFYPHICMQCGSENLAASTLLCLPCEKSIPYTKFISIEKNSIEKIFWGRVPIKEAGASLFFTKESIVQSLLFALKYKHQKKAGWLLGNIIGQEMLESHRFKTIDCMIPIPLTKKKQRKRGYNQAMLICEGIQQKLPHIEILPILRKLKNSTSQTGKGRIERSLSISHPFTVITPHKLMSKNIVVVDDVITTGATLEAACKCLWKESHPCSISIVATAYTL